MQICNTISMRGQQTFNLNLILNSELFKEVRDNHSCKELKEEKLLIQKLSFRPVIRE